MQTVKCYCGKVTITVEGEPAVQYAPLRLILRALCACASV